MTNRQADNKCKNFLLLIVKYISSLTDWIKWSERDGILCRNDLDCNWIHPIFYVRYNLFSREATPYFQCISFWL